MAGQPLPSYVNIGSLRVPLTERMSRELLERTDLFRISHSLDNQPYFAERDIFKREEGEEEQAFRVLAEIIIPGDPFFANTLKLLVETKMYAWWSIRHPIDRILRSREGAIDEGWGAAYAWPPVRREFPIPSNKWQETVNSMDSIAEGIEIYNQLIASLNFVIHESEINLVSGIGYIDIEYYEKEDDLCEHYFSCLLVPIFHELRNATEFARSIAGAYLVCDDSDGGVCPENAEIEIPKVAYVWKLSERDTLIVGGRSEREESCGCESTSGMLQHGLKLLLPSRR